MSAPAILIRNVRKRYRRGESVDSLRDLVAGLLRPAQPSRALRSDEFWALNDVSFEVARGEAFGVIGPNGAGKSTLLKLLAGIIRPDHGHAEIAKPVSALIELGAGFHPDLTGEENIYLNAAILGMSRRDTRRRFGDIVAFADIGEFLSTPVKRYSSGMQARLAFAIAAHIEPRVLLVDEVLSVGDRVFRARCMDKMRGFLRDGVAVVFVSHDLASVANFCPRTMVMARGQSLFCGATGDAIGRYYDAFCETSSEAGAAPRVRLERVRVMADELRAVRSVQSGDAVAIEFDAIFAQAMRSPSFGLSLTRTSDQQTAFETSSNRMGEIQPPAAPGERRRIRFDLCMNLTPAEYDIGLHVREHDALDYACQKCSAARIVVSGATITSGTAFLNPRVSVVRECERTSCAAV